MVGWFRRRVRRAVRWFGDVDTYRTIPWFQIVKASLAAGLSWGLARWWFDSPMPALASLAAILSVAATVHETFTKGVERTIGVFVGVMLAFWVASFLGVTGWTVALVVFAAYVVQALLRLTPNAGAQVPVTAMLVLALGVSIQGYAWVRVEDTALGAAVGIIISLITPPVRLADSGRHLRRLSTRTADVFARLGNEVGAEWPIPDARRVLADARRLERYVDAATNAVDTAADSLRWNVRTRGITGFIDLHRQALTALDRVSIQARGVARAMLDESSRADALDDAPGEGSRLALAAALRATASAVRAYGQTIVNDEGVVGDPEDTEFALGAISAARDSAQKAMERAQGDLLGSRTWLVFGSILADVTRALADLSRAIGDPVDILIDTERRPRRSPRQR